MLAKNKKVSNLLVGVALISTVGTTTTTSLSLTSMLGTIFGLGMTGASVAVYLQELPIIFGLPLSAIAATLGIVGAHKAYEIYKKEPSILIPSDIRKHILEREFGSMEKYHSELKSAWKYIGCSLAPSIGATIL